MAGRFALSLDMRQVRPARGFARALRAHRKCRLGARGYNLPPRPGTPVDVAAEARNRAVFPPGRRPALRAPRLASEPFPLSPQLLPDHAQALLALADGTTFHGASIGAAGETTGEVVFNTALTGYQEILTDPSYCRQIVTLTDPHIGNYGANREDVESAKVHAAGLVVKDLPAVASNFRSTTSLGDYLRGEGTVAIAGIDTRRLTRLLRSGGAQNGSIVALAHGVAMTSAVVDAAVARARSAPSMSGLDLARVVSVSEPYEWGQTTWSLGRGYGSLAEPRWHVVAYDFGVKFNILRMLAARGCRITVVPAETPAAAALALAPDGIFLANGPGDPEPCAYAIEATREFIARAVPTFGICLGHQIMALAAGARTYKMKFGHHGANHPVKDLDSGRVSITSQNHGFAVDPKSLPATLRPTHVSLFDGTLQGLAHVDKPAFCFQGHPEASPGPHDIGYLFDRFVALMQAARGDAPSGRATHGGSAHA
jgi:carbamoyl-phosphate synthase small subunit